MSNPIDKRERVTKSTQLHDDNMRALIEEFGRRPMMSDDVCDFLKFSPSGSRKYVRDLVDARVIVIEATEIPDYHRQGLVRYALTADPEPVRAFLAVLARPAKERPAKPTQKVRLDTAGKQVHILAHDSHCPVRLHMMPARRDPLVEALFGPAPVPPVL